MAFVTFFVLAFSLLFFGLAGIFLNRKNVLLVLMSVELMLLSINFALLIVSRYIDDRYGQIFAIFILTVAAAESSIGLAILISFYRLSGTIALEYISSIKG
jgi:NADH-quinone oxidoreductase subunit K